MRVLIGLVSVCLVVGAALPAAAQSARERGRYLVDVLGACGNCHTPKGPEGGLPGKHLAGGFQLDDVFGTWITPNITPNPETGIGRWTDEELIRAIREGRGRDGSATRHFFPRVDPTRAGWARAGSRSTGRGA